MLLLSMLKFIVKCTFAISSVTVVIVSSATDLVNFILIVEKKNTQQYIQKPYSTETVDHI